MSHHNISERGKYTAIYRSPDDVNNFKISIRRVVDAENTGGRAKVFSWQQKVYGKFEREFYRDRNNCVTDLEKKYHEDVVKLVGEDDDEDVSLFTYVNQDEFNVNEERINKSRCYGNDARDSEARDFETMQIVADLGEYFGNTWLKSEHVLCTIKYEPRQRFLLVRPDFTGSEPYCLMVEGDHRRLSFRYYIQDASEKMSVDLLLKETEILNKVLVHRSKSRFERIGGGFEPPPKGKLRAYLFFEILTARNFEHNHVYVEYLVDLPREWHCKDSSTLRGTTHTCRSFADDNSSHFGHPFEICIEYDEFATTATLKAPHVYFEVISKDSWNRYRTEGLTYVILPISQPGCHRYDLHCLRICPRGPRGNLRRFFIGDYSNYADVTWVSVPKHHDKNVVNKYGVNTVSAGELSVRINVLHQSQGGGEAAASTRKSEKFILEKLNASSLVKSIEQVLEAFKAAKRRMIETRKNLAVET